MWLLLSSLAAICFGIRGILYHWTSQKPMNRNLMLFGVFLNGAIICAIASFIFNQPWTPSVLIGILMGVFSFAANASMYKGFAVGKTSLIAIFTGLPPVVVVLGAFLLWGETLSMLQFAAFFIIIAGILLVRYSSDISLKQLNGAQWGILAMLFFGFNDLTGKQSTLLDAALLPTMFMLFFTGSLFFCTLWLRDKRQLKKSLAANKAMPPAPTMTGEPWSDRKTFLWGMVVGITNVVGMIFILTAFKYGVTGLVSAVVAMNIILILLYSRLILKDKFTPLEFSGLCLSLVGIIVLRVLG